MKNKKGFTLTEIMVVVLIMASLAAVAYPMYSKSIVKGRMAEAISLAEIVRSAQQRYFIVNINKNNNSDKYFPRFTNAHVTGTTKLVKGSGVTVSSGVLKKGLYTITIKNPTSHAQGCSPNSCIEIVYGEAGNPVFKIQALVEDSKIYCWENGNTNGICDVISDVSANTLCRD